jgi:hypothetical protein
VKDRDCFSRALRPADTRFRRKFVRRAGGRGAIYCFGAT